MNYFFRIAGTEGHAFGVVEAIEIPKNGKKELTMVKFVLETHGKTIYQSLKKTNQVLAVEVDRLSC